MAYRYARFLCTLLIALLLVACGGGGDDDSAPGTPIPGNQDTLALAAQLTANFAPASNTLTLNWKDSFPGGTRYQVQARQADSSYLTLATVAGAGGSGAGLSWQTAGTVTTTYRVQAVQAAQTTTIKTPQAQSVVEVLVPAAAPVIQVTPAEPLSGIARLSIGDGLTYPSVTWYVDLRKLGTVSSGAGNPLSWDTSGETNGVHLVIASIQTRPDSYTEVRQNFSVANANLALGANVSGTTGMINVDIGASSAVGIARVEALLDNNPLGSLTAPNACSRFCTGDNDRYRFTVNAALAGSGAHTVLVTATDTNGISKQLTVAVPINNLPVLGISSPVDGAFVNGLLTINGTSTSDKPGTVTTRASLGDFEFLNTTNAAFTGSMSLAGLPAGAYTLTVRATDSSNATTVVQKTLIVTSAAALTYTPLFSIGAGGQLLAADGDRLLYASPTGNITLRNTSTGAEVNLADTGRLTNIADWQISQGRVYVQGRDTDCIKTFTCIYEWAADGSRTNLSTANPLAVNYEVHPVAMGNLVVWTSTNAGGYTLFDALSRSYRLIAAPAGANYVGNGRYDLMLQAGNIIFFYWAQTGGVAGSSAFDVYRWDSLSNTSTRLSEGGARNIYPQTDTQQVAWLQTPVGDGVATLRSQGVSGGVVTDLGTNVNQFRAEDGVTAWLESTDTERAVRARYQGVTHTLSTQSTAVLYGTGGGTVLFGEGGKAFSWNAATGGATRKLDAAPNQTVITGGQAYFIIGNSVTVYRMDLD